MFYNNIVFLYWKLLPINIFNGMYPFNTQAHNNVYMQHHKWRHTTNNNNNNHNNHNNHNHNNNSNSNSNSSSSNSNNSNSNSNNSNSNNNNMKYLFPSP